MKVISSIIIISTLSIALTACSTVREWRGGERASTKVVDNANDITRPPAVARHQTATTSESNPDETVSFDEWRKQRQAESSPE